MKSMIQAVLIGIAFVLAVYGPILVIATMAS